VSRLPARVNYPIHDQHPLLPPLLWRNSPTRAKAATLFRSLDHTNTHHSRSFSFSFRYQNCGFETGKNGTRKYCGKRRKM
jgi:hypothetical protein